MTSENESTGALQQVGGEPMADAIEGAAFLARSAHRVRVLELLSSGPQTRETLLSGTDVTRVTLSRILGDLTDRGWIERDHPDNRYVITDTGAAIYDDFDRLLETITVGQRCPDVIDALPTEWFGFELRCLADCDIVATDSADPLAGMRVIANAVGRATTVRAAVSSFASLPMYTHSESVRTGDAAEAEVVFDRDASAVTLENQDLVDRWRAIEAESARPVYYSADERFPCNVDIIDGERVFLSITDENGGFRVVESTHSDVVDWAEALFREKRTEAVPLERYRSGVDPVDSRA